MDQIKRGVALIALGLSGLVGCAPESAQEPERERKHVAEEDERPGLCARDREDAVRDVFCAPSRPKIRSLEDLQERLGLQPDQHDGLRGLHIGVGDVGRAGLL